MQSATAWRVLFSENIVSAFAWGRNVDEHTTMDACLSLVESSDEAVVMVVVGANPGDILVFDFGRFWGISTYRRALPNAVTYRAGRGGLLLSFHTALSLDRFEAACLPYRGPATPGAPTLEQLRDLGLVATPKLVGSFLLEGPTEAVASSSHDWAGSTARPPAPFPWHSVAGSVHQDVTGRDTPASGLTDLSILSASDLRGSMREADEAGAGATVFAITPK